MSDIVTRPPAFGMFTPEESGMVKVSDHWYMARDGDLECYALYRRHYSAQKNRYPKRRRFVGPGERMVLLSGDGTSLFVWRKTLFRDDDQKGVNCAVFRNEGDVLSSLLIAEASELAWIRWPGTRLFTFVDAGKVRHKRDPGRCFIRDGWRFCGKSKSGLLIFEKLNARS